MIYRRKDIEVGEYMYKSNKQRDFNSIHKNPFCRPLDGFKLGLSWKKFCSPR